VDVHTVEELTLHTGRQTSRSSGLEAFGVDVVRDLLRAVRGEPRDQDLARRLGGSDGLRFESAVELPDLGDKCRDLLAMFESESYKTAFAWYDHLRPVSDPAQIAALDERLLAALVGDRQHQPHLAPPEPLDWDSVEGLTFSKQRDSIPGSELELDDYLLAVGDLHELSRDDLHRDRVAEWRTGATRGEERWSVYDCLVFETEADGAVFVLTRGRWFRVDRLFARLVKKRVTSLPQAPIELPNARPDETREDLYNARAARECGLILMDRKTASATGARGQVELCDLMSTDGFFVHVKRWSRSSTLSHLFLQGTVSADTYLSDAGFRKKMRARLKKIDPSYGELIPTEAPDRASIKVVYCVVGKPGGAGTLPFFSQLALDEASRHLGLLGVGVYTRFVGSG
jgi:uncharacterized protein (TIGR04141 family)